MENTVLTSSSVATRTSLVLNSFPQKNLCTCSQRYQRLVSNRQTSFTVL